MMFAAAVATAAAPPAKFIAPLAHRPLTLRDLDQKVYQQVLEMFRAYERRSVGGIRGILSGGYRSQDDLGFGYSTTQLPASLSGDFRNLKDIEFHVVFGVPEYSADYKRVRVDVQWTRRARFATSGEEWLVSGQRSTLELDRAGKSMRVASLQGAPLIALTNPTGVLVVDRGTVDGREITGPVSVLNGRLGAGVQDLFSFGNNRRFTLPAVALPQAPAPTTAPPVTSPNLAINPGDVVLQTPFRTVDNGEIVKVTVRNVGNVISAATTVRASATNYAQPPDQAVPPLAPGASQAFSFLFLGSPGPAGFNGTVTAIADPGQVSPDPNRANNTQSVNYTVAP